MSVQIACNGKIISDRTSFEFRDRLQEMAVYKAWFMAEGNATTIYCKENDFHIACGQVNVSKAIPVS